MRFYVVFKIRNILRKLNNLCKIEFAPPIYALSLFIYCLCYFVVYFTCLKKSLVLVISLNVFQYVCNIKINTYVLIVLITYKLFSKLITNNGDLNSYIYFSLRRCVLFMLSLLSYSDYCYAPRLSGFTMHITILVFCYCDCEQTI